MKSIFRSRISRCIWVILFGLLINLQNGFAGLNCASGKVPTWVNSDGNAQDYPTSDDAPDGGQRYTRIFKSASLFISGGSSYDWYATRAEYKAGDPGNTGTSVSAKTVAWDAKATLAAKVKANYGVVSGEVTASASLSVSHKTTETWKVNWGSSEYKYRFGAWQGYEEYTTDALHIGGEQTSFSVKIPAENYYCFAQTTRECKAEVQ